MNNTNKGIALGPRQVSRSTRVAVVGIGLAMIQLRGKAVPHYIACCGPVTHKFCVRSLGRAEAFRRALKRRAAYEQAWAERRAA